MEKHNELSTHHVRMSSILNYRDREVGGKLEKGRGNKKERERGRKSMLTGN